MKKLTEAYDGNRQVQFIAVQTVFEGYDINTRDKLRQNQLKYDVKIPMAHAAGDPGAHSIPEIMKTYRSGGTPWAVIIDPYGMVVYNGFHIEAAQAIVLINQLIASAQ